MANSQVENTAVDLTIDCAVCGERASITTPLLFRCVHSTEADRRHLLQFHDNVVRPFRPDDDENPFIAFRRWLAVDAYGAAVGLSDEQRVAIIRDADRRVAEVSGTGFHVTPFERHDALSDALGFSAQGGVWVKDETHNVAGSQKARHLFTTLLYLLMGEAAGAMPWTRMSERPRLAIASCGNAAIAASTLAASAQWPIEVFVPVTASPAVIATLRTLGAHITECPRLDTDPPGDPCIHRFREAVSRGSLPFSVQGPENLWCLDGGRTIGWEMVAHGADALGHFLDRVFVQVGGGAFATCVGSSFRSAGVHPRLHAVQTEGCAPLARAWSAATQSGGARNAGPRWSSCMWAWEHEPHSLADGILDDETYDWIGVLNAMSDTGGSPIVAPESTVRDAYDMAHNVTTIPVSPTGSSGLAGLIHSRDSIADDERVAVIFSGVQRD